jgi:hypothetical protein
MAMAVDISESIGVRFVVREGWFSLLSLVRRHVTTVAVFGLVTAIGVALLMFSLWRPG